MSRTVGWGAQGHKGGKFEGLRVKVLAAALGDSDEQSNGDADDEALGLTILGRA